MCFTKCHGSALLILASNPLNHKNYFDADIYKMVAGI